MRVGVLGSGAVAQVLAAGFVKHGHEVMIGSRDPEKLADWNTENPKASRGTFAEAAAFGEVLVLAVKGSAASGALGLAGAQNLGGKACDRRVQSHCRCAACQWRASILHRTEPIADGAVAARIPRRAFRESLQLRRQHADDRSHVRRGQAHDVYLRQRRCGEEDRYGPSSISLGGRRPIWAVRKPRALSNRCACSGVFRASCATSGRTLSSC